MEPPVLLLIGLTLTVTVFCRGDPQNEGSNLENVEEERRSFTKSQGSAGISQYGTNGNECYACTDCPRVLFNTTTKQCGFNPVRCIVFAEKYNYISKPIYVRGCLSERGSCDEIRRSHEGHQNVVKMLSCQECTGDRCNGNSVPRFPDVTTALFFITVTTVVTKYALS